MKLSSLAAAIFAEKSGDENAFKREISALNTDSRKRTENALFVCLSGRSVDSHECIKEAKRNGAVAIVAERKVETDLPVLYVKDCRLALSLLASYFYGEPSKRLKVIAITGTNGKTTTSYILAEILRSAGKKVGIIGTLGAVYGRKNVAFDLTTPDPIELQALLADMVICGIEYVVMEVSAHALFYKKTDGVRFEACIYTNLTQDHLDFFGCMTEYQNAKRRLFLDYSAPIFVLNGDDACCREIILELEEKGVKSSVYGLTSPADYFALITEESLRYTEIMLNLSDVLCAARLNMAGRHNVYNALAAATCAIRLGVDKDAIEDGLKKIKGVCGRLELVGELRGADIFVDFAHTPDGLEKSLHALKKYCKGRLICLFGCGGNRDKTKRSIMGETAAKKSDFSVLTSDNPRYEDPLDIIAEIEKGYRRFSARYVLVPDRKKAINYALDILKEGDILLIAGKGGERSQEIMGIKYDFDEHTVIEELLEEKRKIRPWL